MGDFSDLFSLADSISFHRLEMETLFILLLEGLIHLKSLGNSRHETASSR